MLADQAVDDLPVRDPGGHIERLAGLVQRRSLLPRLVRRELAVAIADQESELADAYTQIHQ